MKPFVARCIQYIALALTVILCFGGAFAGPNYWLMGAGLAIGLAGTVIWLVFGRCPHCGEHLGRNLSEHCPHCGKKTE